MEPKEVAEGMEVDTANEEAEDTANEAQDMIVAVEEVKNVAVMVAEDMAMMNVVGIAGAQLAVAAQAEVVDMIGTNQFYFNILSFILLFHITSQKPLHYNSFILLPLF